MSIWSRNHTELAKLARTLHDRNVKTRNNLSKRLAAPNPLDPRKCKSESCLISTKKDTKENGFSTTNGDITDEGPADRLRVDSFSSVDSAISPDFHRSPLSPILKQSYLTFSDTDSCKLVSCNGNPISKSSDKKVTFLLQDEDNDEYEACHLSGETVMSNRVHDTESPTNGVTENRNISYDLSSFTPTSKCGSTVSLNVCDQGDSSMIQSGVPNHLNSDFRSPHSDVDTSSQMLTSDSSSQGIGTLSTVNSFDHENYAIPNTVCIASSSIDPSGDFKADVTLSDRINLPTYFEDDSGIQSPKSKTLSSHDDVQKVSSSTYSSGLNLSDELNILLISLLANHRREQFAHQQESKTVEEDVVEDRGKLPTVQNSDQQNPRYLETTSDKNGESEMEVISPSSADVKCEFIYETEKLLDAAFLKVGNDNATKYTYSSNYGNGTLDIMENENSNFNKDIEVSHSLLGTSDDANTIDNDNGDFEEISAQAHFVKDGFSSDDIFSSHSPPEKVRQGCDVSKIETNPPCLQMPVGISSTLVTNTGDVSRVFSADSFSCQRSPLSSVHCRGYCKNDSSANYTIAGNSNPSCIYSHLYAKSRNFCDSTTPDVRQNGNEILPKTLHSSLVRKTYALDNKSPDEVPSAFNFAIRSVPGNAIYAATSFDVPITTESPNEAKLIELEVIPNKNFKTEGEAPPLMILRKEPTLSSKTELPNRSIACQSGSPISGLFEDSFNGKCEDNVSQHDAFTQTQNEESCDKANEKRFQSETTAVKAVDIPSTNCDFIQNLADSARRKIWLHVTDRYQTSKDISELSISSHSPTEDKIMNTKDEETTYSTDSSLKEMTCGFSKHEEANSHSSYLDTGHEPLPISSESRLTSPSSSLWDNGDTPTRCPKVGKITEMTHVSSNNSDFHYNHISLETEYKSTSDKKQMCLWQENLFPKSSEKTYDVVQEQNLTPSITLSPHYSPFHGESLDLREKINANVSSSLKENASAFKLSCPTSDGPSFDSAKSKGTANLETFSRSNDINMFCLRPKSHSDDAIYKSSSPSFVKSSGYTSSFTSSTVCGDSLSTQKPKSPRKIDIECRDIRPFKFVTQEVFIESSSYDSDTSSVFWSRASRNSLKNCGGRHENQKLSIHDQLNRINDNISWIMKSRNISSSRKKQDDYFSHRKPRRKKKVHGDSYAKCSDVSRKTLLSRSTANTDNSSITKTPSIPRSREFPSSDSFKKEAKDINNLDFVIGNTASDLCEPGKHYMVDSNVRNFQNLFENLNSCDPAVQAHPSKDLKTVKDALCQLKVFIKQQRHCNKQNVFKEINDRSKLFQKISSLTENCQNARKGTKKQSLPSSSEDSESRLSHALKYEERFDNQQGELSDPDSSLNAFDGKSHQNRQNALQKYKSIRKLRKINLTFLESLLDKAMTADADDLCSRDVLKDIVREWQSVKGHSLGNSFPYERLLQPIPASTNGLIRTKTLTEAAHPLTVETHSSPFSHPFQTPSPALECAALLKGHISNGGKSDTLSAREDREELTEAEVRPPRTVDSTTATHAIQLVETQEYHTVDEAQLGEDKEISAIMESDSQLSFRLDREFDKNLADMKPFVLKLLLKTDRQKCAVWIKKFCDPPGSGSSVRKTRNMYAQLMLQMLKKGSLSSPFDQKPEDGPLQPLPSYMSIYFDDPLTSMIGQVERLPDWVEGELGEITGSSLLPRSLGNPAATSTWVSSLGDLRERPHSSIGHTLDKDPSLSPIRHSEFAHSKGYSVDDMSIEIKRSPPAPPQRRKSQNSPEREKRQLPDIKVREEKDDKRHQDQSHNDADWSKPYASTISTSLPKGTTFHEDMSYHKPADREVAVRTKMIEAKFHEEKLKLQQKHDAAVQKILDRKNTEIEDVKNHYRAKSKEMEETIGKLEKKVQTLIKETDFVRESKDKQISEVKKLTEDSNETRRKEFEKRLHDVMTEFEQEKFEMQKQHTQNIQEILDDTNNRLQRMESEYSQQTTTTTNVIKELESRVQQLMNEVDSSLSQRSAVEKDRNETQAKLEKLTDEYERLRERHQQVERDHQVKTETHEHELRSLKNKTEASLEFLKQEHTMAASKASDTISEFEQKVEQLKKSLKDSEENRHRQNREMEQVHQQDKLHIENLHDKQVRNMKKEMEQLDADWSKKLAKLEQQVKDKEGEISKLREQKQQQAIHAEQALEEFKSQVEKNQARMYDEMKQQMDQVENDLSKSKQLREKQSKEFARQQEDDKYKHQHEIAELKMSFEGEKSQIMRDFHVQKEYIISEHDKDIENLKEMHRAEIQAIEARMRERQDKSDKIATDSERLIRELREELVQANQLRKQQLVELGLLREEEKQKVQRDHEAELARIRTDMEQQRLEQQKAHSTEMESVLEKTNERLKGIEQEYAERGNKSAESIAELQSVVLQLRGDIKRSRESSDEKLAELKHQYDEERQNLRKQYAQNMMSMQKELEAQHSKSRDSERQLQKEESDHEEKVTQLKLQFEEKIRGLMPASIKQELEDTIASLKSQVASLQQRALMLQEELDSRNRNQLGPFGSRTSSPIKSTV